MLPLKYNTASQVIILGPFLDDTDGKTAETALSIANTDIKLKKHNGTVDTNKNSGGATHIANGYYYCTLDATDTNTIGRLTISVNMAGVLPVWHEFIVYPAEVFDYLYAAAGTDYMKIDIAQVDGAALGTHASGLLPSDLRQIVGAAVDAALAQLGINVVNWKGSAAPDNTGDAYGRLGAPAGASVSVDIAAVKSDTGAVKTKTDQLVFTIANKVDASIQAAGDFAQAAADKVWGTAARALTDKAGFSLSAAGIDAIFDEVVTGHATADTFGLYLTRLYQYFMHKLNITDATGAAALRNAGDTSNIATWMITDDDTTTIRAAASWI